MKAGTSKKPKYLPIHTIRERLKNSVSKIETILPFHAITGCDTVSFFAGHSKKTAWCGVLGTSGSCHVTQDPVRSDYVVFMRCVCYNSGVKTLHLEGICSSPKAIRKSRRWKPG